MRTKQDPKQILIQEFNVPPEALEGLDDKRLRKMVRERRRAAAIPSRSDPGWHDYVMSLFSDTEMEGDNPRLEGLRRVTAMVIGPVVAERCLIVSPPGMDNRLCAVARASITIHDRDLDRDIVYEAAADAGPHNCSETFGQFPTAMADTRAKGRAFRSALGLQRVLAAEELGGGPPAHVPGQQTQPNEAIRAGQMANIRVLSDRVKVSLPALFKDMKLTANEIRELTHQESLAVVQRLNEFQQAGSVPDHLKSNATTIA